MEAVIAIAVLIAIVWWIAYVRFGSMIDGCLLFLVVAMCFGRLFFGYEIGPVFLTFDRILLVGLLAAYMVQRRLGRTDPKPMTWPDIAMLLLAMLLTFSVFSHDWESSVDKKVAVWQLIAGFVMPMLIYWMVHQSRIDRRALLTTYVVLGIVGVYLSFTALAEINKQWWMVFPNYIADPAVGIHFGRARGPMVGSHTLGMYLVACLLSVWMLRKYQGQWGLPVLFLLLPLFLVALYLTYTRGVWMSAALCGLVVLGLPMPRPRQVVLAGFVLAAASILAVFQWENLVRMERTGGAEASEQSAESRLSFAYVSWNMFLDHPLMGVGYGQFPLAARDYLSDRTTSMNLENIRGWPNHNMFLALLTETGLVGFALFVTVLAGWIVQSLRLWSCRTAPDWARDQGLMMLGAMAIYLSQAMFADLSFAPDAQYLTFLLAGLTTGLAGRYVRPIVKDDD